MEGEIEGDCGEWIDKELEYSEIKDLKSQIKQLQKDKVELVGVIELALSAFEKNYAIDWAILENAINKHSSIGVDDE